MNYSENYNFRLMSANRKFVITSVNNPVTCSIPFASSSVSAFSIDRFEWYPPQQYSSAISQVNIVGDIANASYAQDGSQTNVMLTIMRNQDNVYKRVRKTGDELFTCNSSLPSSMNFGFTDQNGNALDLGGGGPTGTADANAVNYLLEFTLYY